MDNKVNLITIEKYQGGFIIKYKGKNVWKQENPTIWELVEEPCQIYTSEEFAKNEVRSLKMYVTKEYNGNYEEWEEKWKERF